MGKPVIAGTLITGDSVDHIVSNYPHIAAEDIGAAQGYADLSHRFIAAVFPTGACPE